MMNVLVTGGAGFIGSHIVDAFVNQGHRVTVLDDLSSGKKENINPKAEFVQGDIRDKALIEQLFKSHAFDLVAHFAAHISLRESLEDPIFDLEVNTIGTLNLLEAASQYGCKQIAFASTGGSMYGESSVIPTPESEAEIPISPYSISKLCCEKYIASYSARFGIKGISFRFSNVYGPRQSGVGEAGVIAIFADRLKKGEPIQIFGDGEQTRDFIYVDDAVDAVLKGVESNKDGMFNISTAKETNINGIAEIMLKLWGSQSEIVHTPEVEGELRRSVLSFDKANKVFGYSPSVSIEEGLRLYFESFHEPS